MMTVFNILNILMTLTFNQGHKDKEKTKREKCVSVISQTSLLILMKFSVLLGLDQMNLIHIVIFSNLG